MAAVRNSAMKKNRAYRDWVTPMSRTRPACARNSASSALGCPNSLTRSAPDTLKRSTIVVFMSPMSS